MTTKTITAECADLDVEPATDPRTGLATVNEVRLVGRLSAAAADRDLPSGDVITTFRVVVYRPEGAKGHGRFDALECHTWSRRVGRAAHGWGVDDVVEVRGALRRRFFRAEGRLQSMTEVEVFSGRVVRRRGGG